jgi:hypothetical protein
MSRFSHKTLFLVGGILVLIGFIVPLLMVLGIIKMMLWLEMLIAIIQVFGIVCGIIGSVIYVKEKRSDKDRY